MGRDPTEGTTLFIPKFFLARRDPGRRRHWGYEVAIIETGRTAPAFTLANQNGSPVSLSDLKGKIVIVYFYPKASTPGCTTQACGIRDNLEQLIVENVVVLGVSPDPIDKLRKFHDKYQLNFDLLSDEDHSTAEAYGTWGLKKFMGKEYMGILRSTIIIDEAGMVVKSIEKVNTKTHHHDLLSWLSEQPKSK